MFRQTHSHYNASTVIQMKQIDHNMNSTRIFINLNLGLYHPITTIVIYE